MNSVSGQSSPSSTNSQQHQLQHPDVDGNHISANSAKENLGPVHLNRSSVQENVLVPIDPSLRLKIERLESALKFLGLSPTEEQHQDMRSRLEVDSEGTVAYGEFVSLAREIFAIDLPQIKPTTPLLKTENSKITTNLEKPSQDTLLSIEVEQKWANRERDQLIFESSRLEDLLQHRDLDLKSTEIELLRLREELQSAIEDNRSLRSRLRLAEEAQKAARRTEEDYEEVLRMLEVKLLQKYQRQHDSRQLSRSPVLLEHETRLKMMEVEKKMFEVATERLLQFTASVREHLDGLLETVKTNSRDAANGETDEDVVDLSQRLSRSAQVVGFLSAEARNTTEAVQSLLEMKSESNGSRPTEAEKDGYFARKRDAAFPPKASDPPPPDNSAVQSSRRTSESQEILKSNKPRRNVSQSYHKS